MVIGRKRSRLALICAGLLLAGLAGTVTALSSGTPADTRSGTEQRPVTVVAVPGTDLHRLTYSTEAVDRLGLRTAPVTALPGAAGAVPLDAVHYNKDGSTWVYVSPSARVFERQRVTLARIAGTTAVFTAGPAVGTQVAVVGVAELSGAEYGVGGEQ